MDRIGTVSQLKKRRKITYWRKLTIYKQLEAPFRVG